MTSRGEKPEIHILETMLRAETEDEIAEMKSAEREGLFIAHKIREMMDADPTLRYRDFAILTRAKSSAFTPMLPVLLAENIPAYADGAAGYFESLEISLATALLKLIANRRSDVELIAILHSPVVGLNAEELARIRIRQPEHGVCRRGVDVRVRRGNARKGNGRSGFRGRKAARVL